MLSFMKGCWALCALHCLKPLATSLTGQSLSTTALTVRRMTGIALAPWVEGLGLEGLGRV